MSRITSLNMLTTDEGKAYLAELYSGVIENVQKNLISATIKNQELSGDPVSGSVEAKRFANANSQDYGTARSAGKGSSVKSNPVTVMIDTDKEIVEELEEKDIRLYGVDGVLERRAANHVLRMVAELDNAFFAEAAANAVAVSLSEDDNIEEILEAAIQECENTKNNFVDGVPRSMMHLVCGTKYYGKIRNNLDKQSRSNIDTAAEEFLTWHGVETHSCTHLPVGVDFLVMVTGAVAQPVMANQYAAEKIPLSNAYGVSLFYDYGTKAVTPDLIFKPQFYTQVTISAFADGVTYYTYNEKTGIYTKVTGTYDKDTTYYTKN